MTKATLEIPSHERLDWRTDLIRRHLPKWYDLIAPTVFKKRTPSASELKSFDKFANAEAFQLTEVDFAALLAATLFSYSERLENQAAIAISQHGYLFKNESGKINTGVLNAFLKRNPKFLGWVREFLRVEYHHLLITQLPAIRAKLACLELIALVAPDSGIPKLIGLTPIYIKCNVVQSWLNEQISAARYLEREKRNSGRKALGQVFSMMKGKPYAFRRRKYPFWELESKYNSLIATVKQLRLNSSDKNFLRFVREHWNLNNHEGTCLYQRIFLDEKPEILATEILVHNGMINGLQAFKHIQSHLRNLRKNQGTTINEPAVQRFLDYPRFHPEIFAATEIFEVLENIPIKD